MPEMSEVLSLQLWMQDFYLERRILTSVPTLQHAVVGFPVPPPEGFPEACGLCSLITFLDGDLAAAVKAGFQRTTAKKQSVSDYVVTTELLTSGKQRFALTVLWSYWQQCAPPPACAPETCSHATGRWGPGWCSAAPWRLLSAGCCSDRRPPADGPLPPPPHAHSTDANHLRQRGQMNGSERDGQVIWRCLKQRS